MRVTTKKELKMLVVDGLAQDVTNYTNEQAYELARSIDRHVISCSKNSLGLMNGIHVQDFNSNNHYVCLKRNSVLMILGGW